MDLIAIVSIVIGILLWLLVAVLALHRGDAQQGAVPRRRVGGRRAISWC